MRDYGEVNQMYLSELHSKTTSESQSSLSDFTDDIEEPEDFGTTIAVVTDPTGDILKATDEYICELGMPEVYLNSLRDTRNSLSIEDDVERHNKAVEQLSLEEKYREHIQSGVASEKIDSLVERVKSGEDITLVCFEKAPKWCHRHILKEVIQSQINTTVE